jgi:hypothetical protein
MDARPRQAEESERADGLQGVADQDDVPAVKAVSYVAGGENEDESGQKQNQAGIAKVDGFMRDLVNLPRDGERLGFCADDDAGARKLIAEEVAGEECGCGLGHA